MIFTKNSFKFNYSLKNSYALLLLFLIPCIHLNFLRQNLFTTYGRSVLDTGGSIGASWRYCKSAFNSSSSEIYIAYPNGIKLDYIALNSLIDVAINTLGRLFGCSFNYFIFVYNLGSIISIFIILSSLFFLANFYLENTLHSFFIAVLFYSFPSTYFRLEYFYTESLMLNLIIFILIIRSLDKSISMNLILMFLSFIQTQLSIYRIAPILIFFAIYLSLFERRNKSLLRSFLFICLGFILSSILTIFRSSYFDLSHANRNLARSFDYSNYSFSIFSHIQSNRLVFSIIVSLLIIFMINIIFSGNYSRKLFNEFFTIIMLLLLFHKSFVSIYLHNLLINLVPEIKNLWRMVEFTNYLLICYILIIILREVKLKLPKSFLYNSVYTLIYGLIVIAIIYQHSNLPERVKYTTDLEALEIFISTKLDNIEYSAFYMIPNRPYSQSSWGNPDVTTQVLQILVEKPTFNGIPAPFDQASNPFSNFLGEVGKGNNYIVIVNNRDANSEEASNILSILPDKIEKIADFACVDCIEDDPNGPFYNIDLSFYVTK